MTENSTHTPTCTLQNVSATHTTKDILIKPPPPHTIYPNSQQPSPKNFYPNTNFTTYTNDSPTWTHYYTDYSRPPPLKLLPKITALIHKSIYTNFHLPTQMTEHELLPPTKTNYYTQITAGHLSILLLPICPPQITPRIHKQLLEYTHTDYYPYTQGIIHKLPLRTNADYYTREYSRNLFLMTFNIHKSLPTYTNTHYPHTQIATQTKPPTKHKLLYKDYSRPDSPEQTPPNTRETPHQTHTIPPTKHK